jgi:Tol biopolymer transport system component
MDNTPGRGFAMKTLNAFTSIVALLAFACNEGVTAPVEVVDAPFAAKAGAGVNGLIAYAGNADGDFDIYVAHADGSGTVNNVTNYSPAADLDPVFSPDGKKVVFVSNRKGNTDLYRIDLQTGVEDRLTTHGADDYAPTYSPDGTEIAFATMRNGDPDIYILDLVTMHERPLVTNSGVVDVSPDWSPSGKTIAFRSGGDIYLVRPSGTQPPVQLTTHPLLDDMPAWLPDESEVSFVTWRNGSQDIYAITTDGSGTVRAVASGVPAAQTSHVWSTEGLAYTNGSATGGTGDIYVYPMTGPLYNLTPGSGTIEVGPDWWVKAQ